ncbi:MAG: hypothetical protein R6U55_05155 [Desulfovermiculus sp.]
MNYDWALGKIEPAYIFRSCCIITLILSLCIAIPAMSAPEEPQPDADYGAAEARKLAQIPEHWITADHSGFEILDQDFTSGPEVTEACLSCHNEAAEQVHETIHWSWICPADPNKIMGKNGLTMNNF